MAGEDLEGPGFEGGGAREEREAGRMSREADAVQVDHQPDPGGVEMAGPDVGDLSRRRVMLLAVEAGELQGAGGNGGVARRARGLEAGRVVERTG